MDKTDELFVKLYKKIKEEVIEEIRAYDPADDKPDIPLKYKNIVSNIIGGYFEDKIYDIENK